MCVSPFISPPDGQINESNKGLIQPNVMDRTEGGGMKEGERRADGLLHSVWF